MDCLCLKFSPLITDPKNIYLSHVEIRLSPLNPLIPPTCVCSEAEIVLMWAGQKPAAQSKPSPIARQFSCVVCGLVIKEALLRHDCGPFTIKVLRVAIISTTPIHFHLHSFGTTERIEWIG